MSKLKKCIVVAKFGTNQPGFLDFSYRIKSLATVYQLTVISNFVLTQKELLFPNIEYIVIDGDYGKGRLGWLRYMWACGRFIRQQKPNLAVFLTSAVAPVVLLVGKTPSVTYWNEHPTHIAPEPEKCVPIKTLSSAFLRWILFEGARRSDLVMPIGEAHRDDLLAHGCEPDRVKMIYMGVDRLFSDTAIPDDRSKQDVAQDDVLQIIYVGTISPDRGRDVMLEAMTLLNHPEKIAHLIIVGANDAQLEYCQKQLIRLQLESTVTVYGRVPGNTIPEFLSRADVGLCLWEDKPWYRFNPPTKLFEYLVAGLPVLASNIRTHTQYIENGVNGFIFEYDSASLARVINHIWENRAELPKIKLCAKQTSTAYFWETIEPAFLKAVQEIAN